MMQSGFFMVVLVSCVGTTIALQDSLKEVQASKDLRFEENDGKYDQNQSGHDTTFEGGNVELSKRSDDTTCRPLSFRKPLNYILQLSAMDIMKGTLATELLLQGAILVKGTYNCKLYWKKGDSFSASAEFGMIFAKNVQTMQLAQGVIKEGHLGDRIIIMRTDTVTSTAEITVKLLMFEMTIRIQYSSSMTSLYLESPKY